MSSVSRCQSHAPSWQTACLYACTALQRASLTFTSNYMFVVTEPQSLGILARCYLWKQSKTGHMCRSAVSMKLHVSTWERELAWICLSFKWTWNYLPAFLIKTANKWGVFAEDVFDTDLQLDMQFTLFQNKVNLDIWKQSHGAFKQFSLYISRYRYLLIRLLKKTLQWKTEKGGNTLLFPCLLEKAINVFQKVLSSWCIYMLAKQRLHIWNEFCTQLACLYGINFKWSGMVMPFQCYICSLRLPGEPWHPSWNLSLQHSLFITLLFSNTMICKLNALSSVTCGSHVIPIDCICCPVDKCG